MVVREGSRSMGYSDTDCGKQTTGGHKGRVPGAEQQCVRWEQVGGAAAVPDPASFQRAE